jgi:hypothetical protein
MPSKINARQIVSRDVLDQIAVAAGAELDNILRSINSNETAPLSLSAVGTNRVVNIGSIFVTNPETSKNKTTPTINNALPNFTSGTVTAPATGAGSITVSAGSPLTIAMTANQFLKIGININNVGNISLSAGTAGSSLTAATAPAPISNTFSPGYIVLRTDSSNNMANILNSDIFQYVGGGGGGGSSGGSSTEIIQANTFSPGNLVYLNGSTYTLAKADSANTASVVGVVSVATSTQFTLNTSGLVTGLSGLAVGADYFLSATTAGLAITTEPTTTGYVSQPIGIALSATELLVAIKRGVVIGTSNVFTSIGLANTSPTTIQNISSFANGEGGVLTGVFRIDATTDYVFGFEISFTKDIAGVINHSVRYFAGDVLPGISVTVSGQNIQVTLGTLAGFVSATARFQLAASAVSPSLQISARNVTGDTSGTAPGAGLIGETVSVAIPNHIGSTTLGTETTAVSLVIPTAGTWDIFCDFSRATQLSTLTGGLGCLVDTFIYNGATLVRMDRHTIATGTTNTLHNRQLTSPSYITTGSTTLTLKIAVSKWAGTETITVSNNSITPSNVSGNGFYAIRRV